MNENEKQEQWLVKDGEGEDISVFADYWECGGDGLIFFVEGKKVAWFVSWLHFRKVVADANLNGD